MAAQITPHLLQLRAPAQLADLPGWLVWRFEQTPGGGKPRKVPYYAGGGKRHGVQGRTQDREQLVTFEAAKASAARRGFDGVGFAPMPEWGVCALDFDDCVQGGRVDPLVEDLVATTYAEFSPSGRGVRAFVRGKFGNRKSHSSPETFGFETFSSKGFVTFTGNPLPVCREFDTLDTIAAPSSRVQEFVQARFGRERDAAGAEPVQPLGVRRELLEEALDVIDPDSGHDDWLHVGMALHHETAGEAFELWDTWSARGGKYPGRDVLEARWESFGRHEGPAVTVRSLIRLANEQGAHINLSAVIDASAFDDLTAADAPKGEADKPLRFTFQPIGAFVRAAPQRYLIKGILPQAQLAVVYGESGSGKTFAVLDLVMAIARGIDWRGRRTTQARVAYIAAEGAGGLRKRAQAYADFHGIDLDQVPVAMLGDAPNLLLALDAKDVIRGIQAAGGAGLVVIDTLAQTTPGANENAAEDMGRALEHCRQIHRHTGATVLLVHHSGKDSSRGARGWSGLKAAADAELEVVRNGDARLLRLTKAKDDVDGSEFGFRLNVVSVGTDEDGDALTSCVIEETEVQTRTPAPKGDVQKAVVRVLRDVLAFTGEDALDYEELVTATVAQLPAVDGKRDRRDFTVRRALGLLQQEGAVAIDAMRVSLAKNRK